MRRSNIGITAQLGANLNYFVRPVGTTYGSGDGLSYDNAFSGFAAIDWTKVSAGKRLFVCGSHSETLTIENNGVKIYGNYSLESGLITGDDIRDECLVINNHNYISINNILLTHALVSCLNVEGTSNNAVTNNIETSYSGNQGVQHQNTVSVIHNNLFSHDNGDDGLSSHGALSIIINNATIYNNPQNIAIIGNSNLEVNDSHIYGSILEPVYCAESAGVSAIFNRCIIEGGTHNTVNSGAAVTFNSCLMKSPIKITTGTVNISKSLMTGNCYLLALNTNSTFNIQYSGFINSTHATHICDVDSVNSGIYNIKYSVFDDIPSTKSAIVTRTALTQISLNNCTITSLLRAGNGLLNVGGMTVSNTIFTSLGIGIKINSGVTVADNCCFYDNTTSTSGTITNNSPITTDPKLKSVATNDYSLDTGSSCIGTGKILTGFEIGIESAIWGNGTNEIPVVNLKSQAETWDVGAYIH